MRFGNVKNFIRTEANIFQNILLENIDERSIARESSKSFHSVIVTGKKEFSKNLCFNFITGLSFTFLNAEATTGGVV